jgi:hypothetical protein
LAKNRKQKYSAQAGAMGNGIKPIVTQTPEEKPSAKPSMHTALSGMDAVSYSLGYVSGKNNAASIVNLNIDRFERGFRDGYAGRNGQFSEDEIKTVLTDYKANNDQKKKGCSASK